MKNVIDFPLNKAEKQAVEGTCRDCGQPCYGRETYIVRPSVWNAAGLRAWRSGFLHLKCLEKRLGRRLKKTEFRKLSASKESRFQVALQR